MGHRCVGFKAPMSLSQTQDSGLAPANPSIVPSMSDFCSLIWCGLIGLLQSRAAREAATGPMPRRATDTPSRERDRGPAPGRQRNGAEPNQPDFLSLIYLQQALLRFW